MEEVWSSNSVHCLEADPSIMLARSVPALDYFSIGYFFHKITIFEAFSWCGVLTIFGAFFPGYF